MEGSKYAERLQIGLEKVIRTASIETLKRFHKKWYHLHSMAVIAVGDYPDTKNVVELIRTHFGEKNSTPNPPIIPLFPVPSHEEPRFSCFVGSEAAGVEEIHCVGFLSKLIETKILQVLRFKHGQVFLCSLVAMALPLSLKSEVRRDKFISK
ncbi:hypothetical protein DITRI_Ditri14bG0093700 [Diplodiscus trichospermus]